jgi:RNA polymerase sigma-70 factor, ECF subfamily
MTNRAPGSDEADLFERERRHLLGVAYRLLGTVTDAEDVLQDVFERWLRLDHASVVNPAAYLTTMTTRASIDRLRSARAVREVYVGPWLPEPVATPAAGPGGADRSPESLAELDESLSIGYLHLLEQLTPHERAAHLLHDVYDFSFREVASMIDRSEAAARQLASRARSKLKATRPDRDRAPVPAEGEELVQRLVAAMAVGDIEGVMAVLADDVVHLSDGGAQHRAARRPVVGRERVARLLANLAGRLTADQLATIDVRFLRLNQQPGMLILLGGEPFSAFAIDSSGGRIERIYAVVNPDKLGAVQADS